MSFGWFRMLAPLALAGVVLATPAWGQTAGKRGKEPVADGRPLSAWVADLKAAAPQTRNAAAYEIAGLGPAAAPAVPALVEALRDPSPAVRFPVTVALREIGPAAKAAVPELKRVMDEDMNDDVAAAAKRAIRAIEPEALASERQ
jgi:hypothetical protein